MVRPDTTRRARAGRECTELQESYNDPEKIEVPSFKFKDIQSVKACAQAAGWQVKTEKVDENTYGEGTVMNQFPSKGTDVDPKDMPTIVLNVSTGNPPS
jgi:beta-lactam-binding protein with PASTA domain